MFVRRLFVLLLASSGLALAASGGPPAVSVHSLAEVNALSRADAARKLPVTAEATVLYFRGYEHTLYLYENGAATFVLATTPLDLRPGDRVRVHGVTQESFRTIILSSQIELLGHGPLPVPTPISYSDAIHARYDGLRVRLQVHVTAADMIVHVGHPSIQVSARMEGEPLLISVDRDEKQLPNSLLDADIEVTGVISGRFDGKMQYTGIELHVSPADEIRIVHPATASPWSLPLTPFDQLAMHGAGLAPRVHLSGVVTYYHPGAALVLAHGTQSVWITTSSREPLAVGQMADVIGFPTVSNGFLGVEMAEFRGLGQHMDLVPVRTDWHTLSASKHIFDLVTLEGQLVRQVHEATQDVYVLTDGSNLFSAILHPGPLDARHTLQRVPEGARVRVTGICINEDSNPFNQVSPFHILLRDEGDVVVVSQPSLLTVRNLGMVAMCLLALVLSFGMWGWMLRRKVDAQTRHLAESSAREAIRERQAALVQLRRSAILEEINGTVALESILEHITEMVTLQLNDAICWCELADGRMIGAEHADAGDLHVHQQAIPAHNGPPFGVLAMAARTEMSPFIEQETLASASRLAALAFETRRLYKDLIHRSEFDLLTDLHNRFSLDRKLETMLQRTSQDQSVFGLIYIDLDGFKGINDQHGHQVGDRFLQEVAQRMKRQLRSTDVLARIGGDEFLVLTDVVRTHADVDEIAERLERSFCEPVDVDGLLLDGSASIGVAYHPMHGTTREQLMTSADQAMYRIKRMHKQLRDVIGAISDQA